MKTLHLRRHTLNTAGFVVAVGHALAKAEGQRVDLGGHHEPVSEGADSSEEYIKTCFARVFHGPLIRTLQTAYAFSEGLGYLPTLMPAITGLGDDKLFSADEMVNDAFRGAQKAGKSNLNALIEAHPAEKVVEWRNQASTALNSIFDQMQDEEFGVGFFHSPTIELAALAFKGELVAFPEGWDDLKEMDGLVIVQSTGGIIGVHQVIRAQREVAV